MILPNAMICGEIGRRYDRPISSLLRPYARNFILRTFVLKRAFSYASLRALCLHNCFVCFPLASCTVDKQRVSSPAPEIIFGNPYYQAISYGGYRWSTREDVPAVEQLVDVVKILAAMDINLLRTYNTPQFPQAKRLLQVVREVKSDDPSFKMYVMLGAWIESKNA